MDIRMPVDLTRVARPKQKVPRIIFELLGNQFASYFLHLYMKYRPIREKKRNKFSVYMEIW